jgi:hypothetical protein
MRVDNGNCDSNVATATSKMMAVASVVVVLAKATAEGDG